MGCLLNNQLFNQLVKAKDEILINNYIMRTLHIKFNYEIPYNVEILFDKYIILISNSIQNLYTTKLI